MGKLQEFYTKPPLVTFREHISTLDYGYGDALIAQEDSYQEVSLSYYEAKVCKVTLRKTLMGISDKALGVRGLAFMQRGKTADAIMVTYDTEDSERMFITYI